MIGYMLSNKNLNPVVTKLRTRGRKVSISLVFITQSCCAKNIRLNSTHYFTLKIKKKRKLQQIAFNHSSYIDFKGFMNRYQKCTAKPFSFLVIDAALTLDNPSHFKKNLSESM